MIRLHIFLSRWIQRTTLWREHTDAWVRMHARLMRDVRAQHRTNRIKKRKLRALRTEVKRLRKRLDNPTQDPQDTSI